MAKKKPTAEAEAWPHHKMGKFCGYNVTEDGKIIVAPTYADQFDQLGAEAQGVDKMLEAVTAHAMRVHAEIAKKRRTLWVRMSDDYGLDTSLPYSYAPNEKAVYLVKQESETSQSTGAVHE